MAENEIVVLKSEYLLFVEELLKNGFHRVKAYQAAYPGTEYFSAAASATRLLKMPEVKEYLNQRMKENQLSTNEILGILQDWLQGDIGDYLEVEEDGENFRLNLLDKNGNRKPTRNIRKLKIVKKVRPSGIVEYHTDFELQDAQAAADKLLRVQGAYKDALDLNVKFYKVELEDDDNPG